MISAPTKKIYLNIALVLGLLVYLYFESANRGDFNIFIEASKGLFKKENIYEITYFDGFHYYYSILFAILIYPLTFLSFHEANFVWLSINVIFLYRLYVLFNQFYGIKLLSKKQQNVFWLLTLLFSARLVLENMHVGQMTICLLYLCLEGLHQINQQKTVKGSALIALGINIKLMPLVILPYLIYRAYFKASLFIILFYALLFFLPILFIGYDYNNQLITSWFNLINPANTRHILDVGERSFHGLSTLLSVLLIENTGEQFILNIKRNILNLTLEQLKLALLITRLALVSFTLYFIRSLPFKSSNGNQQIWEFSYILLLIPLIFPHQQHYAFLFIIPAYAYCLLQIITHYHLFSKPVKVILISSMSIIYILVNLNLLIGEYKPYYEHFKILTFGALFLIPVLAYLQPKTVKKLA